MNLDKSKQLKIDTSMKLNKKNVMTPTSQISKPICIEAGTMVSKEKKKKNKKKHQKRCGHKDCNVKQLNMRMITSQKTNILVT